MKPSRPILHGSVMYGYWCLPCRDWMAWALKLFPEVDSERLLIEPDDTSSHSDADNAACIG